MSSLRRRPPFYEHLRHQLDKQQEIGTLPYSPILRDDNKYYFVEESRSTERASDVVVPLKGNQKTKVGRESSIVTGERDTKASVQPTSIITQDYNTALNSIHCQPFVACCCAYPYCELPSINQRNFGSTYDTERTYFQQLQALNSLLLPNVSRMAYEREKLNVEHSTKDYDPSVASKRGKFLFSAISGKEFEKVSETNPEDKVENIRDEKLPFLQAWSTRKKFKIEKSISKKTQSINLEQKRKLESCESETGENRDKKRFKSELNQNTTTKGAWLEFRPNVDIEKPLNYSKFKKDFSATSDGVSNIRVAKERDVLALQSKDSASKRGSYETKNTASSESLEYKRRENRVGEVTTRHHAEPVSPAARSGLELNRNNASQTNCEQQQQQSGNEFISLDSTKSSFLTLMKKIRDEAKNDVIPCPYCCQTFMKYPDLKTHVQTHRDTRTSAGHNVSDVGGQKNNWLPCHSGRSTKTPHFPVVVQGSTDDNEAKKRPTSVIKFAGQNN